MERPFISLKLATSLDGKIALANGQSKWITGEEARAKGRELRGKHDAIAIGSNTALSDDPKLTTRITGATNPIRVVYDSRLQLSPISYLAMTAKEYPVILFHRKDEVFESKLLKDKGITLGPIGYDDGLDILDSLAFLAVRDVKTLLIEGGGTLAASFIRLGLVDEIHWFRAPVILGGDGRNGIGDLNLETLPVAQKYVRSTSELLGHDTYEIFTRKTQAD